MRDSIEVIDYGFELYPEWYYLNGAEVQILHNEVFQQNIKKGILKYHLINEFCPIEKPSPLDNFITDSRPEDGRSTKIWFAGTNFKQEYSTKGIIVCYRLDSTVYMSLLSSTFIKIFKFDIHTWHQWFHVNFVPICKKQNREMLDQIGHILYDSMIAFDNPRLFTEKMTETLEILRL